jgi:O-antigen/teichoic acid export membrane protein
MIAESASSRLRGRIARWTARGMWAVVDQALFAGSNLIVNLLLARWLPAREYGVFVAAYVVLILIGVGHGALLIEPMMVFGPSRYADRFDQYLRSVLRLQWVFSAAAMAILTAVAVLLYVWGSDLLGRAFLGLACAAPFILTSWLVRRVCYVRRKPAVAALGGALYLGIAGTGSVLLYNRGVLTPMAAQLLMGLAACAAVALILRLITEPTPVGAAGAASEIWAEHWKFGRWAAASGLLYWAQGGLFYLLLPLWNGLEATAALRALTNFVMPVLQSDSALMTLLAPELARVRGRKDDLSKLLRWAKRLFAIEGLLCWVVVVVFRRQLIAWVYGGKYDGYADLLIVLGVLPLLGSRLNILGAVLRVFERTSDPFYATAVSSVISLALGLTIMATWGIYGAVFATIIGQAAQLVGFAHFLRRPAVDELPAVPARPATLSRVLEVPQ